VMRFTSLLDHTRVRRLDMGHGAGSAGVWENRTWTLLCVQTFDEEHEAGFIDAS
jgi:hypothetical protein